MVTHVTPPHVEGDYNREKLQKCNVQRFPIIGPFSEKPLSTKDRAVSFPFEPAASVYSEMCAH